MNYKERINNDIQDTLDNAFDFENTSEIKINYYNEITRDISLEELKELDKEQALDVLENIREIVFLGFFSCREERIDIDFDLLKKYSNYNDRYDLLDFDFLVDDELNLSEKDIKECEQLNKELEVLKVELAIDYLSDETLELLTDDEADSMIDYILANNLATKNEIEYENYSNKFCYNLFLIKKLKEAYL